MKNAECRIPNAEDGSAQPAARTRVQSQIANRKSHHLFGLVLAVLNGSGRVLVDVRPQRDSSFPAGAGRS